MKAFLTDRHRMVRQSREIAGLRPDLYNADRLFLERESVNEACVILAQRGEGRERALAAVLFTDAAPALALRDALRAKLEDGAFDEARS